MKSNFIEKTMKRYISRRCTITITIHNSDDATQPHTQKCTAGYKLSKSQGKDQLPNVHRQYQTVYIKWKTIGNSNTHSENIHSGWRDGI